MQLLELFEPDSSLNELTTVYDPDVSTPPFSMPCALELSVTGATLLVA